MNTIISFEVAKMLKEKEFKDKNIFGNVRLSVAKYYNPNGLIHDLKDAFEKKDYQLEDCFNAPTIAEVVMWLYEKHGIWICVNRAPMGFDYIIENKYGLGKYAKRINSPNEAYEAAIKYVLTNLI